MRLLVAALAAALFLGVHSASTFDVRDYGAVGDGTTLCTTAFTAAIADGHAAYLASGQPSTVLATANGTYLIGAVELLSGITLRVDRGSRIFASANYTHYPKNEDLWAVIYSRGATDLAITGGGVIDGNFQAYIAGFDTAKDQYVVKAWNEGGCTGECRPRLVKLWNSSNIVVEDVTFTGAPDWTFHLWGCSAVRITRLTQHGDERWPNNDGVDIDSSQHVLIEDSAFDTGDDAICIKGTAGYQPVFNVTVRNSSARSRSSAIKFGSACPVEMRSLRFENITIGESNRGLGFQARDGGWIHDVVFRNISITGTRLWPTAWWGAGDAIWMSSMLRSAGAPGCNVTDVLFEDIAIAGSQNAAVILSGLAPGLPLKNITLRRISALIDRRASWNYTGPNVEYDPTSVVSPGRRSLTGWMPGFFAEGVQDLTLEDVDIRFNTKIARPAYWGSVCMNISAAGAPVSQTNVTCPSPPPPQQTLQM